MLVETRFDFGDSVWFRKMKKRTARDYEQAVKKEVLGL